MTLKWTAVLVAAIAATLGVTANVAVMLVREAPVPVAVNLLAGVTATSAIVLAVLADLHERLDARLTALTEFLVARLDEIDSRAGDRNAGFVEGYLLGHQQDPAVIPLSARPRGRRALTGQDD